jgi:hypothetical protein
MMQSQERTALMDESSEPARGTKLQKVAHIELALSGVATVLQENLLR